MIIIIKSQTAGLVYRQKILLIKSDLGTTDQRIRFY